MLADKQAMGREIRYKNAIIPIPHPVMEQDEACYEEHSNIN